jgi:hypothetical protein
MPHLKPVKCGNIGAAFVAVYMLGVSIYNLLVWISEYLPVSFSGILSDQLRSEEVTDAIASKVSDKVGSCLDMHVPSLLVSLFCA